MSKISWVDRFLVNLKYSTSIKLKKINSNEVVMNKKFLIHLTINVLLHFVGIGAKYTATKGRKNKPIVTKSNQTPTIQSLSAMLEKSVLLLHQKTPLQSVIINSIPINKNKNLKGDNLSFITLIYAK